MRWMRLALILVLVPLLAAPGIPRRRVAAAGGGGLTIVQTCAIGEDDDSVDCAFGSNITSGNTVVCIGASETASNTLPAPSISGTGTLGAWADECAAAAAGRGTVEIASASVTGSGTATITLNWSGTAGDDSSAVCLEFSSASNVIGFTADVDGDNPQAESFTVTANGSYVVGGLSDWNAVADTQAYIASPAQQEIFSDETGVGSTYTSYFYRTTNTVNTGAQSFGFSTHASAAVGHCAAEVLE